MLKRTSKRYKELKSKVSEENLNLSSAVKLLKECSNAKFDESIEFHIKTNADPKHADQQLRETTDLPNGTGKEIKILVFVEGETANKVKDAGASYVIDDSLSKQIEDGWDDFDVAIATKDMMPKIAKFGKYLGRKGLMPNPKSGTVTMDVAKAVSDVKKGKLDFKVENTGIIHVSVGKVSFDSNKIAENANELLQTIIKLKPSASKGTYMKSVFMSSTMGLGIQIDANSLVE